MNYFAQEAHRRNNRYLMTRATADTQAQEPMFVADDIERWGFIAHELQATLIPSAATGVKDQADAIQSLNVGPIIAALTRALQESMSRIQQLEAMIAPLLAKPASH